MKIDEAVKVFQELKSVDTNVKSVVIFTDALNISHGILCEKSVGKCLKNEISINEILSLSKCFCFEEVSFSKHETNNTTLTLVHVATTFKYFEEELKKYSNLNLQKVINYGQNNFASAWPPEFFRENSALITLKTQETLLEYQKNLKERILQLSEDVKNYLTKENLIPEAITLFVKNHVEDVFNREFNFKPDDETTFKYSKQIQDKLISNSIKDSTRYLLFNQDGIVNYWALHDLETGNLLETVFFNTNEDIVSLPEVIFQALKGEVFSEKSTIKVLSSLPENVLETMLVLHKDNETLHIKEVYEIAVNL